MGDIIQTTEGGAVHIDPDGVQVGDYIPPADIEAALELSRTSQEYAFALLRLGRQLEVDLAAAGRPAMVRHEGHGLLVMTAPQAVEYTDRLWHSRRGQMRSVHMRCSAVLASGELTPEQRAEADRQADIRARVLQAMEAALEAHEGRALKE